MKKGLIFWGGWDGHQPELTSVRFGKMLEEAGFEVDIYNTQECLADAEKLKEYDIIVFSQSYESPFSCLDEITKEIREISVSNARILFDTLLSSGNTNERFAEACYTDDNFVLGSFQFVEISKKDQLRKYCAEFFCENREILEFSILTPIQKKLLSKGITI